MRVLLALLGMAFAAAGVLFFVAAAGAMQEAVAGMLLATGAVLFTGAAIMDLQTQHNKKFTDLHEELINIRRAIERGQEK